MAGELERRVAIIEQQMNKLLDFQEKLLAVQIKQLNLIANLRRDQELNHKELMRKPQIEEKKVSFIDRIFGKG